MNTRCSSVHIVDDDEAVRTSLAFYLRTSGFSADTYSGGHEFTADLSARESGCVLLDIRMPGMDGFEVISALAAHRAELPVVVMTGHGDVSTAVRAMKAGAVDFLEKPFEEDVLLEILARVFADLAGAARKRARSLAAAARLAALTERERDVLHGLIAGRSNKILAFDLGISVRTVEMHRSSMMDRLGVRTFAEALRVAFDGGDDATLGNHRAP